MRRRIGVWLCSLALLQILGGHWAFLQAGAWVSMILCYSQTVELKTAITQTFDGEHPCPICKTIQEGKKQEQKKAPLLNTELKKEFLAVWNAFHFHHQWLLFKYRASVDNIQGLAVEPAVPPPRC
jgi:hypothetical protein